mmetsp:Transcript_659/g.1517  ORF Transcript_659/g.1517 Transcript_659/m.1517 type:complete len:87 (+) Transcript_659:55-315(+)|eukprot:CAMPEP_0197588238 /NCGR_PEP_ID=MMETSP1326-20131121/9594_1 /TAXON_ID=1155430 /ORGANISM="Genus nov. species nov., Strain RCC2288" /LENGTH=86 /DNA_ID=CAMNT_0043153041 /DNA_START=45 /DNA_END=305 /DNA_ORIENTATION=+
MSFPGVVQTPVKGTGPAIALAIVIGFAAAGACTKFLSLNMPFGGKLPGTVTNPEWAAATKQRLKSWPREGDPDSPVVMNPARNSKY